jgi:hypothetical protein
MIASSKSVKYSEHAPYLHPFDTITYKNKTVNRCIKYKEKCKNEIVFSVKTTIRKKCFVISLFQFSSCSLQTEFFVLWFMGGGGGGEPASTGDGHTIRIRHWPSPLADSQQWRHS